MDAEIANFVPESLARHRLLSAVVPMLLISIGYVDPGKWAAAVDGGARFGFDLVALVFVFNLAAILCQYFSARIGLVTGKGLAQICSDEYDAGMCLFLGVQAELSIIALDVTMVLGIAHGINLLFGIDLLTCVLLTGFDVLLFPIFARRLEDCRGKFICICIAGVLLVSYVFGVVSSQPDITLSYGGILTKLNGDSAFALMSLLGANIMPHNFYLHSSVVQKDQGPLNVSKGSLCHDHFVAILGIFSGIYLVQYVLMSSAATVFNSNGITLLTFQDAISLMEQVLRNPLSPFLFLLILYFSSQITSLSWNTGGNAAMHDFTGMGVPAWLHRAIVRVIAVLASLFCIWSSGGEGIYQLLIFTQVMVALLLPSAVIPLFRVSASRAIMGVYKISQIEEYLSFLVFIGMLGLKLKFLIEIIFGNCDWVSNLGWSIWTSTSVPYVVLLVTSCFCICLMLWLLATPLKSASVVDDQLGSGVIQASVPKSFVDRQVSNLGDSRYRAEIRAQRQELLPSVENSVHSHSDAHDAKFDLTPSKSSSAVDDQSLNWGIQDSLPKSFTSGQVRNRGDNRYYAEISAQKQEFFPSVETSVDSHSDARNAKFDCTPLKPSSVDDQSSSRGIQDSIPKVFSNGQARNLDDSRYFAEISAKKQEPLPSVKTSADSHSSASDAKFDLHLPETIIESEQKVQLAPVVESFSDISPVTSHVCHPDESTSTQQTSPKAGLVNDVSDAKLPETLNLKAESVDPVENTTGTRGDIESGKEDDADSWEPDESFKILSEKNSSLTSEGPGSLRSLSGKGDEIGSGAGSQSRLGGLGRAARRNLTAVLEEFWGQLYDYHGQATPQAQAKKLDMLLGSGLEPTSFLSKVDGGTDFDPTDANLYDSLKQQSFQSGQDSYGTQRGLSSSWSSCLQSLDENVQSSNNVVESGERRYSSLRLPPASSKWNYQNFSNNGIDSNEKRYSSLHLTPASNGWDHQNFRSNDIDPAEKRYSSLRLPQASSELNYLNSSSNVMDSSERRYSSLYLAPASYGWGCQNSSSNVIDSGERRYSSLRLQPASNGWDYQCSSNNIIDSGERRYSSLHLHPASNGWDYQNSSNNVIDSGERRYSSLRLQPASNGWGYQNPSKNVIDSGERRYSSLRIPATSGGCNYQTAGLQNYTMAPYHATKDESSDNQNSQVEYLAPKSPSVGSANFRNSVAYPVGQKLQSGLGSVQVSSFQTPVIYRNRSSQSGTIYDGVWSPGPLGNVEGTLNTKKYHSLPDVSGLAVPGRELYVSGRRAQLGSQIGVGSSVGRLGNDTSSYLNTASTVGTHLPFDELSPKVYSDALSLPMTSHKDTASLWSRQPFEQFGVAGKNCNDGTEGFGSRLGSVSQESTSAVDSEAKLLQSFRHCIIKLLKLEGSDGLFRQHDGVDEDLIDSVAAREKLLYEAEVKEMNRVIQKAEPEYSSSDRRSGSTTKSDDIVLTNLLVSSVPHCGEGCVWRADLVISFGVWCIHRILDLALMESRPELWGKYTYVLNRLQGVITPAFLKPRTPMTPCFCLQIPTAHQQSTPISNGVFPPTAKPAKGKCTTAASVLDLLKDVEIAISCRKGRSGTAAGDVAFPKGKGNLTSVLKRYKRRLSKKP